MTAPTVKVKPMVWEGDEAEDHDLTAQPDPYHRYTVRKLDETRFDVILDHELGSLWFKSVKGQVWTDYASAKAAAQADYEARALSAIDTTDLDAHIGAVLAEAAQAGYVACAETRHVTLGNKVEAVILALRPTALTALDRAIEAAVNEALERAAREAENGWLYQYETAPDRIRALIEAERGQP